MGILTVAKSRPKMIDYDKAGISTTILELFMDGEVGCTDPDPIPVYE